MSTDIQQSEQNVENVENTDSVENVETETAPDSTPEAKPSPEEMFEAMDDTNPAKGMVQIARTQLAVSLAAIKSDSERLSEGLDSVDREIDNLVDSSEDTAIVELRNSREALEAELESVNAQLRDSILAANPDLHPMSDEEKTAFEKALAERKAAHKSTLTAMEKAVSLTLGEADAKYLLSDLVVKASGRGGSGTGTAKPRFESAAITLDGERTEIQGDVSATDSSKVNLSSGHVAAAINKACDFNAVGNKVKPSEITDALVSGGYNGTDSLGIDFTPENAPNKTFRISVTPKK